MIAKLWIYFRMVFGEGLRVAEKNKKNFLTAFFVGISPDLFSFGVFTFANILGISTRPDWGAEHVMREDLIPQYVHNLYNVTHSLIVFALVFAIVWMMRKKPSLPLLAWGLHILMDIPTHTSEFFATPFLWPFSKFEFDGINWGNPIIFFPNIILLAVVYFIWAVTIARNKRLPLSK